MATFSSRPPGDPAAEILDFELKAATPIEIGNTSQIVSIGALVVVKLGPQTAGQCEWLGPVIGSDGNPDRVISNLDNRHLMSPRTIADTR